MPQSIAVFVIVASFAVIAYAFIGYPLLVALLAAVRGTKKPKPPAEWPRISVTVPAYNEEREIAATIEALLDLDYPRDKFEILVVSDASTDRTDEIVRGYADRGVKLLRMEQRSGKTAAENAAAAVLTGDIVVNTDASIRIPRNALKPLIAAFVDPAVGVASGRDISVARGSGPVNPGESRYVGYEMAIRALETRAGGIIGASGCLYAIRAHLHRTKLQEGLSRDFASALIAREHGYRAVSVDEAVCYVPRTPSVRREYTRKVRTMTRGMETLFALRALMNPFRYGAFAWMLWSHKVVRWMVPWASATILASVLALAPTYALAQWVSVAALAVIVAAIVGFKWPSETPPKLLAIPTYLVMGNLAAMHASLRAMHGDRNAIWEPTRREVAA